MTADKLKIDFHCHTHCSLDSIIKPRDLAAKAKRLAIIPAITDHNTLAAHAELRKLGARFIPGEEIRTLEGDLIGLYINEPIPKRTPFLEALDLIKEQGGLSCVPHMFDMSRHGMQIRKLAAMADMIETFNARCMLQQYNKDAETVAKKYKKPMVAGSDSHFLFEFGRTFVLIDIPDFEEIRDNPKGLLRALKEGRIYGSRAPAFVRGPTMAVKLLRKFFGGLGFRYSKPQK